MSDLYKITVSREVAVKEKFKELRASLCFTYQEIISMQSGVLEEVLRELIEKVRIKEG